MSTFSTKGAWRAPPPSKTHLRRLSAPRAPLALLIPLTVIATLMFRHGVPHTTKFFPPLQPVAKIAYYIHADNSTASQVPHLLQRLHHPFNIHLVHFDATVPKAQAAEVYRRALAAIPPSATNVHLLPAQFATQSGISAVLNTLSAISFLLREDDEWHYFINLSAADYPLVPPDAQRRLLSRAVDHESNFIELAAGKEARQIYVRHASQFHVDLAVTEQTPGQVQALDGQNPLAYHTSFVPATASPYMMLSRQFAHFATTSNEARIVLPSVGYIRWPAQHFFAILAWNSAEFNGTVVPNAFRLSVPRMDSQSDEVVEQFLDDKNVLKTPLANLRDATAFFAHKFRRFDGELTKKIDAFAGTSSHVKAVEDSFERICQQYWDGKPIVS